LVEMANQFVVPVVADGSVVSMVVMTIGLEVAQGVSERIYAREAKLRDAFLRTLFEHARLGGFLGDFTNPAIVETLRDELLSSAREEIGDGVLGILITAMAKRDT